MAKQKIIIIGAGSRGQGYAQILKQSHEHQAEVVAVAEPRKPWRDPLAQAWNLPENRQYRDWREVAKEERFADAVFICTQDQDHKEPVLAFAEKGYHILLEKPMAPTPEDCRAIVKAVRDAGVMMAVCHVLRYTVSTRKAKEIVDAGHLGDLCGIQRLEPVGYWHMAHSFVRGNWGWEADAAFILLAKSCHDIDWIRYLMGVPYKKVSSFGNLCHFRKEHQPKGAAARCLDCQVESQCPYSAKRLYLGRAQKGDFGWPTNVLTPEQSVSAVEEALRTGPYGRCVYACDNDVLDHQVVNMEFAGGGSGVFTLSAFTPLTDRYTRIFGTRGHLEITPDGIAVFDFLEEKWERYSGEELAGGALDTGHGGGDGGLIAAFVEALERKDPSCILSGPEESLETHLAVFAAEKARRQGTVEMVTL